MELPPALRAAVERVLSETAPGDLAATAAALSQRYREERRDGRLHVSTDQEALAYLATRLPATYAAVRSVFAAVADVQPGFAPRTMLDIGAGPGTCLWAAADCWPGLDSAQMVEAGRSFIAIGEELTKGAGLPRAQWSRVDIGSDGLDGAPRDLVSAAYVLNELAPKVRPSAIERLWRLTGGILVIVEPGTPAGWERIVAARAQLVDAGAHVVAPCPHGQDCPLSAPDWCHFAQRVARSRVHRQAKGAELAWEDEKFSYVAVSRQPSQSIGPRVIAHPCKASGRVTLKLCRPDGTAGEELFSRREGELFKRARRADWGSVLDDRA